MSDIGRTAALIAWAFVLAVVSHWVGYRCCQRAAVEHHAAHYDRNGEFEWLDDVKDPK